MEGMVATPGLTAPALPLRLYPHNTVAAEKDRPVEPKVLLQEHRVILILTAVPAVTV